MKQKILIRSKNLSLEAEIGDSRNPKTAREILLHLPFKGKAARWGDEIYFSIPVSAPEENTQTEMSVGDLAFWPQGSAFCIFFGKTPVSKGSRPAAYSGVNLFGRLLKVDKETLEKLRSVKGGEEIFVEKMV